MRDERLHRHYDDDLSAEEKAALDAEIAALPAEERAALGKKLEGLHEVGVVIRAARTDDAPIDSEALWKAIEAKIAAPATEEKPKPALRAIEGGAPLLAPAAEDPRARRRRRIGIFVGAFAIAAAALLMIYGPPNGESDTVASETTPPETTVGPEPATPDETTVASTDYTEVLAVDFGTNVGTIFAVEGEGGQRYAVVWLDDVLKNDELETQQDEAPSTIPD
jgi:hypothetical protein